MKVHGKLKVKRSDSDKTKLTGKINVEDITQAGEVIVEGETSFEELVRRMVAHDMKRVAAERTEEYLRRNQVEYLERGIIQ